VAGSRPRKGRPPRKPRRLAPGDLIGVCAPAGPVDRDALDRGVARLEALGFRVWVPDGILERIGFTAGSVERRVRELHQLFADEAVAGIVCARGGAGAGRLLGHLDAELIAAHHKVFVGYSDITFIHLFLARLGLTSFHGPMVARELADGDFDRESLLHALTGQGTPYETPVGELRTLRPGRAFGRLRGGCLSILAAAAGTRWAPKSDPEGTLLFLEDVDERPYRLDRMLLQLREAGALRGVRGVVFGQMRGCQFEEGGELEGALQDALDGLDVPVAFGCPSGHTRGGHVTLPLGVPARLECGESARLTMLESGVL
jgi:muramoyltetrapeptide carboxypeptidase